MEDTKVCDVNTVTVILLGKRGCDKVMIGNTMVGFECFKPKKSTCQRVVYHMDGQVCCIVNTPDLYHGPKLDSKEEDLQETALSFPGARVFLLILRDDHVSSEEIAMFAQLKHTYGEAVVDDVIVVRDISESKAPSSEVEKNIQRILDECGERVCSFKRGMKQEELNEKLLSQFRRMLQKCAPEGSDTSFVEPCDKTSEKEKARPEPAEENPFTAVPEEGQAKPNVHETLARCSKRGIKSSLEEKGQPKLTEEKTGAAVPEEATVHNTIYESIDETKEKPFAAVPGGDKVENNLYETIDRANDAYGKMCEEEKAQPKPTDKKPVSQEPVAAFPIREMNVLTIVLLGQTGSGKSATGNTILARRHFESRASSTAVTQECEKAEGCIYGINVRVIDTPDFFNDELKNPKIQVQKCKVLSQSESVVYLLVMHMGRFTEGERAAVSDIKKEFGDQVVQQTVVLFTGKEKLKGIGLGDYIKNADSHLQQLIETFGSRYHAFDNNDRNHHQVKELLKIILKMPIGVNFREHYLRYKSRHKDCTVL